MKLPAIICDIDGTIALPNGRNHYDSTKFDQDIVNEPVKQILDMFTNGESVLDIILVTGREEKFRQATENWLKQNEIHFSKLFMRSDNNQEVNAKVKFDIFQKEIKNNFKILFALDDSTEACKMWKLLGIKCLQIKAV